MPFSSVTVVEMASVFCKYIQLRVYFNVNVNMLHVIRVILSGITAIHTLTVDARLWVSQACENTD